MPQLYEGLPPGAHTAERERKVVAIKTKPTNSSWRSIGSCCGATCNPHPALFHAAQFARPAIAQLAPEVIAAKLEAYHRGEIKRLSINLPPQHLKLLCASIVFPAYCLGVNPVK
jgi:hypothetical protein